MGRDIHRPVRFAGFVGIAAGMLLAPVGHSIGADQARGDAVLTVSADDRARALGVLRRDPEFRSLLNGREVRVLESGPWTDATGTVLIGTALRLRLSEPLTSAGAWPGVVHEGHRGKGYAKGTHRLKVKNLTELDVLVDLTAGAVASIEPRSGSGTVTSLDRHRVTAPLPEDGGSGR